MAPISYKKTLDFLTTVFKKKFLYLQVPILLFVAVPFINTCMSRNSSRDEGQALVARLQAGHINMTEFQQELANLSKTNSTRNNFYIPLFLLLSIKLFFYWCAIVSTIVIGLAFCNNTSIIFPAWASLARTLIVIFSYFISLSLFAFPVGFTLKLFNILLSRTPMVLLTFVVGLVSLGLFLFLTSCFSSTVPLILNDDTEIYASIRKSYRMSKNQALSILVIFVTLFIVVCLSINLPIALILRIFPILPLQVVFRYTSGLIATIAIMMFVAFYHQLTSPEPSPREVTPPHGA